MSKVQLALEKAFHENRIVFWYDPKGETDGLFGEFETISLPGIEKIKVENNEFGLKLKIISAAPEQKFLLYFPYEKPDTKDNWLIDLLLANYEFQTNQEAIFLQELKLDLVFRDFIAGHIEFFKSKERLEKLKAALTPDDREPLIRMKMLAIVCLSQEPAVDPVLMQLFKDQAEEKDLRLKEITRFGLEEHLWKEVGRKYGYMAANPSLYDFILEVFRAGFSVSPQKKLNKDARILMDKWKDSQMFSESFKALSKKVAEDLGIEGMLNAFAYKEILQDDVFELVDRKIISDVKNRLISRSISHLEIEEIIRHREARFWYQSYRDIYQALSHASDLIEKTATFKATFDSLEGGIENYISGYWEIDYHYRKFHYYFASVSKNRILHELAEMMNKLYSNTYLLGLNDHFQGVLDKTERWNFSFSLPQWKFYQTHIQPTVEKGQRVFVIISDGLRYESGMELNRRMCMEDGFTTEMDRMITGLPSYTQLGMAMLLPNNKITYDNKTGVVLVDGMPANGTANREKILSTLSGKKCAAIEAEKFLAFDTKVDGPEFVKQYEVIYIYHNKIDKIGDEKMTEGRVFLETEDAFKTLIELTRKIVNPYGSKVVITADHGYIYQDNELEESDFMEAEVSGEIIKSNRRFIVGHNLSADKSLKHFKGHQLGIDSDMDFLIAKSINRMRIKGAGSRYVHGGASLQEVVIPVLTVRRKKQKDVTKVTVDIIQSQNRITTNIIPVSFIQKERCDEKHLERTVRAAFYSNDSQLISDIFTYKFNLESIDLRQREVKHRFSLSGQASNYNHQDIILKLEEPIEGTTQFKEINSFRYQLIISFTNDFDV